MSKNQAKRKVIEFGKLLRQHGFLFSHIYMFGSVATGKSTEESDIDVAVIAKKRPRNFFEKEGELWILAPKVDSRIEPVLLCESDIKKNGSSIIGSEVNKNGLKVL